MKVKVKYYQRDRKRNYTVYLDNVEGLWDYLGTFQNGDRIFVSKKSEDVWFVKVYSKELLDKSDLYIGAKNSILRSFRVLWLNLMYNFDIGLYKAARGCQRTL